jgi:PilZ domain
LLFSGRRRLTNDKSNSRLDIAFVGLLPQPAPWLAQFQRRESEEDLIVTAKICTTASETNRRRSRRLPLNSSARIECRKGSLGLGPNLAVSLLDISENGIRMVLKAGVAKGQEVEISCQGGGSARPTRCQATVAWALPLEDGTCCVGLNFQSPLPYGLIQRLARP